MGYRRRRAAQANLAYIQQTHPGGGSVYGGPYGGPPFAPQYPPPAHNGVGSPYYDPATGFAQVRDRDCPFFFPAASLTNAVDALRLSPPLRHRSTTLRHPAPPHSHHQSEKKMLVLVNCAALWMVWFLVGPLEFAPMHPFSLPLPFLNPSLLYFIRIMWMLYSAHISCVSIQSRAPCYLILYFCAHGPLPRTLVLSLLSSCRVTTEAYRGNLSYTLHCEGPCEISLPPTTSGPRTLHRSI
jgi:hypothetical protein